VPQSRVLTCKASFSGPKSSFSGPQPVCSCPQPCVSLSHFTALHSFPRRGCEREVLSSAPGVQGQDAWKRLRAAPGQVQLGTRIRFCTERAAGRWERLPERRLVPPACPCPAALWAMPSMTRFDLCSALKVSGSWTRWSLLVPFK